MTRNNVEKLDCDEILFKRVIKTCFNQRRKTIRNSIRPILTTDQSDHILLTKRPEQLGVAEFVELTNWVAERM